MVERNPKIEWWMRLFMPIVWIVWAVGEGWLWVVERMAQPSKKALLVERDQTREFVGGLVVGSLSGIGIVAVLWWLAYMAYRLLAWF